MFCGKHLLAAKLRRSNIDASAGAVEEMARLVAQIRARWPRVKILLGADSGFAREELMAAWCEAHGVDYVFGLARNQRLVGAIADDLAAAELESLTKGGPARRFVDFFWRTLDSWSRARRVVAKAEQLPKGANPRFVVTSLRAAAIDARSLYEDVYCARGEVENRIKDLPGSQGRPPRSPRSGKRLDLFADRTSAATMRANQLRLWFASMAYGPLEALRRIGLRHTQFAVATCGTIRLKLLKIGAQVRSSVRRIKVAMLAAPRRPPRSSLGARQAACPYQTEYHLAYLYLQRAAFVSVRHTSLAAPRAAARPKSTSIAARNRGQLFARHCQTQLRLEPNPHHALCEIQASLWALAGLSGFWSSHPPRCAIRSRRRSTRRSRSGGSVRNGRR
jgi:hypothetical protein